MKGLAGFINQRMIDEFKKHLPSLESRLVKLASAPGYERLIPLLRGASDWDKYQEFLSQIDVTTWFKNKSLLKCIEPELPHRQGSCDLLLSLSQRDIYCEVASRQSLWKSIESKRDKDRQKVQDLLRKQSWMSKQDAEHDFEIRRAVRNWSEKIRKQLPPDYPGILAIDTRKAALFHLSVREAAKRIFPKNRQLVLIMLWSLEGGTRIGEPPFWFINRDSAFQNIGWELLKRLGQEHKVLS